MCGRARRVIPEPCIEVRQLHLVIEQEVQRMLERVRQQLAREVHAQELRVGSEGLVAGHGGALDREPKRSQIRYTQHSLPCIVFRFHIDSVRDLSNIFVG